MVFDLQSHSVFSDGTLRPREVVRHAAAAGVELLALTDHDSVDGVAEAVEAGEELGTAVIPATEVTAVHDLHEDLHVLGYGVDVGDSTLTQALESFRDDRELRAERMARRLEELGYEVDHLVIAARREAGKTVGRPHLATAVIGHPGNAERLSQEGLDDVSAFIRAYLISGRPAFESRTRPTVQEAIDLIHGAGGVAVWAHPFWDLDEPGEVLGAVDLFQGWGLDGVEVFYATHSREQAELLADHCELSGLLTTGSADFHGPEHRIFNRFLAFDSYGRTPHLGPIANATRSRVR